MLCLIVMATPTGWTATTVDNIMRRGSGGLIALEKHAVTMRPLHQKRKAKMPSLIRCTLLIDLNRAATSFV
ncbi:hypothetical protein B0J12DRAFT_134122 [Macrophomina phaseolina]|uniref:Secreted protein n=1 Tax=Macrophomina phaseolina TaxID=35725 RepID=A0ABQ8G7Q3_9PEZI|nr:hypothetical protein B0J12DRAFT_134122 [Macrophomina phaseolina]